MTEVGVGGVVISGWTPSKRYAREFKKLTDAMRVCKPNCVTAVFDPTR